jgi:hypothetical protein
MPTSPVSGRPTSRACANPKPWLFTHPARNM